MKVVIPLTSLLVLLSFGCTKENKKEQTDNSIATTISYYTLSKNKIRNREKYNLTIKDYWENITDINGTWISLERDNLGYLVYQPCNGSIAKIMVNHGKISIKWTHDSTEPFYIHNISRMNNNEISFVAFNSTGMRADFKARIVDSKRKLVLWKFKIFWEENQHESSDYKLITTRQEFKKEFRFIDNPCPKEMKEEKSFLPIEFN